ncbi:MAG: YkgJ family cysteine cluster protein [Desulfuromonadales bacterium]|nr:YkgJ family cysteine cluster protein [Desulfuromonadales bacterium]
MKTLVEKTHAWFEQFSTDWQDRYLSRQRHLYCAEACPHCCHLAVHAVFPEAAAVASELSREQSACLTTYVKRLSRAVESFDTLKSYLKQHRNQLGPCPFLDATGSCGVYQNRPLSCRALLSTRPAEWCGVDFSELDQWDKQAYQSSLDREFVAWPTHFVAATQDFARSEEQQLLQTMLKTCGWSLTGNFAVMVWLEQSCGLAKLSASEVQTAIAASGLECRFLLELTLND